jgi:hypothetical protein
LKSVRKSLYSRPINEAGLTAGRNKKVGQTAHFFIGVLVEG